MECTICHKSILGRYYKDRYEHCICASHMDNHEVAQCSSCGAFAINRSENRLQDGRILCANCKAQIVSEPQQIERIKKQVVYWLCNEGFAFKDKNLEHVPITIVTAEELARLRRSPITLANKGITISQSTTTLFNMVMGKNAKMSHKVYILNNLIKAEFAATLAHEFLHIWQNENGVKLDPPRCEGLCNLGSWFVYNKFATKAAPLLKESLMQNPDHVYGDGFRYVYHLYEEIGIDNMLERALKNAL